MTTPGLDPRPARDASGSASGAPDLVVFDADGTEARFDAREAHDLMALTDGLEAATVSACPTCRCRVLAAVALADLLDAAPPFARAGELVELADDAPTLHVYVRDVGAACAHRSWHDPGREEWADVLADLIGPIPTR